MSRFIALVIIVSFVLPDSVYAATEQATFKSFYVDDPYIGWALAGMFALFSGAVIIFTGGTASPIVISIGGWVGSLMGLSGIAATNAGLALLGGGAISSGGFGIVGGTVLVTAALSFSTDIAFDYTSGKAIAEYKYSNLVKQSNEMSSLPLPINESGSGTYEEALRILDGIHDGVLLSGDENKKIIYNAISRLEVKSRFDNIDDRVKNESLLSLLYFVSNDYVNAKKHADASIIYARSLDIRRTLPAFIYATSSLYEESFDFTSVTNDYFRYSVLAEPDNLLIPLMFSIYLDRLMLRFNDDYLDYDEFVRVFMIMKSPEIAGFRKQNYVTLISRYFIRLKLEQQKISSLSGADNKAIKNDPHTLLIVINALIEYDKLLRGADFVLHEFRFLDDDLDYAEMKVASEFGNLLISYRKDRERLQNDVDNLGNYQLSGEVINSHWYIYFILLILICGISAFYIKKYKKYSKRPY